MGFLKFLVISLILHSLMFISFSPKSTVERTFQTPLKLEHSQRIPEKNLNKKNTIPTKLAGNQADLKEKNPHVSYSDELKGFIQSKATYPKSALSLKQEGSVLISLTLNMEGLVTSFKVLKPSRFNSITSAVIKLMQSVHKHKPLPEKFHPEKTFTFPIHYVLN